MFLYLFKIINKIKFEDKAKKFTFILVHLSCDFIVNLDSGLSVSLILCYL